MSRSGAGMWTFSGAQLPDSKGLRFAAALGANPATVADVLHALQTDPEFRTRFNALLADVPYAAFRWESPGVTTDTLVRPFECVVLDAPGLARRPDPGAFAEHFSGAPGASAVEFSNLGGDAVLVAPCPVAAPGAYGHLAAFVREAPEAQRDALWQLVGAALTRRLGPKPVWLSTAGAGVPWLHVRLDDRPKYYGHAPYRRDPG